MLAKRQRVTIARDSAAGGSGNPDYSNVLCEWVPAEVDQVSGGESVRGKQVEANVTFIVCVDHNPEISLDARCKVTVLSGVYAGQALYVHFAHLIAESHQRRFWQLHCGQ